MPPLRKMERGVEQVSPRQTPGVRAKMKVVVVTTMRQYHTQTA